VVFKNGVKEIAAQHGRAATFMAKWSMADVMVVAIFMAYIGFKGIMDSQMGILNGKSETMTTIATNETSLQPGFILFVSYVIFGLILGVILKWITSYEAVKEEDGVPILIPSPTMKDLKSITHSS